MKKSPGSQYRPCGSGFSHVAGCAMCSNLVQVAGDARVSSLCARPRMNELNVLPPRFADWFARQGWTPRRHQLAMLDAARAGDSVLLIAPTGGGKTLAGFLPSLVDLAAAP